MQKIALPLGFLVSFLVPDSRVLHAIAFLGILTIGSGLLIAYKSKAMSIGDERQWFSDAHQFRKLANLGRNVRVGVGLLMMVGLLIGLILRVLFFALSGLD